MEEYINRYKALKFYLRLILLVIAGFLPALYEYSDRSELLEEDLELAQSEKDAAKRAFDKAKLRKSNLPKLEEQLAHTESQLEEASKRLPDNFVMDKILQKTAMIAQELGVKLILFDPQDAIPSNTAFRYAKLPIKLELVGTYAQVATFFDRIVHLELLAHIQNFRMGAVEEADANKQKNAQIESELAKDPSQLQRVRRSRTRIRVESDLIVYRTLTVSEQNAIDASEEKNQQAALGVGNSNISLADDDTQRM